MVAARPIKWPFFFYKSRNSSCNEVESADTHTYDDDEPAHCLLLLTILFMADYN